MFGRVAFTLACSVLAGTAAAQSSSAPGTLSANEAIDRALNSSALTSGGVPFHATIEIAGPTPEYSGTIDLFWARADLFRLQIKSPAFTQLRITNGDAITETSTGTFYPRWLQAFEQALLDPLPQSVFRNRPDAVQVGPSSTSCIRRDDRVQGITDQLTWGIVCFSGDQPLLSSVLTFNRSLQFSHFQPFGHQQIARTYATTVLDYKPVTGLLTRLERMDAIDPALFVADTTRRTSNQFQTTFVSTPREESMMDAAPAIVWPPVREGKTEGYMIVYARTDSTGQVRETAKHNSDNPGLEQFGTEQALRFKFHPLVVNGTAQQMEMPLVLHFRSHIADAIPVLSDPEIRALISGCALPHPPTGKVPFRVKVSVNEEGKLTGETYIDANTPSLPHSTSARVSLSSCSYRPYVVNGHPSYYHGILLLPAANP